MDCWLDLAACGKLGLSLYAIDVYVRSLVVKTPTKHVPAALGMLVRLSDCGSGVE